MTKFGTLKQAKHYQYIQHTRLKNVTQFEDIQKIIYQNIQFDKPQFYQHHRPCFSPMFIFFFLVGDNLLLGETCFNSMLTSKTIITRLKGIDEIINHLNRRINHLNWRNTYQIFFSTCFFFLFNFSFISFTFCFAQHQGESDWGKGGIIKGGVVLCTAFLQVSDMSFPCRCT